VYDVERSYYLPWIKHDLEPWQNGIEQVRCHLMPYEVRQQGP
jgi:hypothetical protein